MWNLNIFILIKQKHFQNKSKTLTVYTLPVQCEKPNTKTHIKEKEFINMSKFVEANEKIAEKVVEGYKKIENGADLSEEKRIEYAKGVTDGSRRLAQMMTNILKLNRLENQQIYPMSSEFDLGEQLCDCLLQFENVWEQAEIEIDTDIAEDVKVKADAELLSLVWNNLFSNAFKFTQPGGTVSVTLTATAHHAIVQVKDTGCGMSAQVGAHIFEKFYQGDTSRSVQGNGLGLALVKRVVDIMHGQISVESAIGVGSTFTVKIRRS